MVRRLCFTNYNHARSTVGVNIPDFTRYIGAPKTSLSQGVWFPLICSWVAVIGIVVTSASIALYGDTLWDPISIVDTWDGPAGRAAAFFAGLSWALAQICVNISATVISGANDMTSLWPKYINIKRGAIILTVLGGWALVPWKIYNSATSLLNFMNSLGIFLSPIMVRQILLSNAKRYTYVFSVLFLNIKVIRASKLPTSSSSSVKQSISRLYISLMAVTPIGTGLTGVHLLQWHQLSDLLFRD